MSTTAIFKDNIKISTLLDKDSLPEELGEFLFLLKGAYAAASLFDNTGASRIDYDDPRNSVEEFRAFARSLSPLQIDQIFRSELNDKQLIVKRIVRASPWEFLVYGVVSFLVCAVTLSGGKVKIGSLIEFELNAIGEGIKKLRESLGLGKDVTAGFGVEKAKIKLSRTEYTELCKGEHLDKNRGGVSIIFI
ncbi:MAG: hypothetical protein K9N47_26990 [Prosthecobacter sp.]|uniref:hypothetical protein n=1 Tax=Prosthecobacter sp. TaxID=1965333 RepID=UPI0026291681|nr:hypothetical protein [Prosthecobacter sp.]MCF7789798.1 hypothetical protein [Prosthecobacter sp.]